MASPKPIRDASGKITDYEFPDSTSPYYIQVLKPPPGVTSGPRPAPSSSDVVGGLFRDAPPQPAPPSQPMGPPEVDANYLRSMLTMGKASGPSAQPMSRAAQMQQIRDQNARIQQESRARNQQIRDQNIRIQQESRLRNQQVRQPMPQADPRMSPSRQALVNQRNQEALARQQAGQGGVASRGQPPAMGGTGLLAGRPPGMSMPSPDLAAAQARGLGPSGGPLSSINTTPDLSKMPARQPTSGGFMSGLSQLMGGKAPMPQPGQVGSATGAMPNIGGFPGAAFKKGGPVKKYQEGGTVEESKDKYPSERSRLKKELAILRQRRGRFDTEQDPTGDRQAIFDRPFAAERPSPFYPLMGRRVESPQRQMEQERLRRQEEANQRIDRARERLDERITETEGRLSNMGSKENKAAYKKGGKVKAKPVAKKAGGKVAAKPVMKKAGGRVAAKPKMKRK